MNLSINKILCISPKDLKLLLYNTKDPFNNVS